MAKSQANPDHLLAPEQFPGLNKAFYATKPWEYFNLLHHASEALLRLYLAHEPLTACPWLDMARVRSPGKFKQIVEARFLRDLP